ncbi:hypothetical protein NL676_004263 [Syzygium grande]|nr:hypothetical protein NL676_004263 [Syzygium grande]
MHRVVVSCRSATKAMVLQSKAGVEVVPSLLERLSKSSISPKLETIREGRAEGFDEGSKNEVGRSQLGSAESGSSPTRPVEIMREILVMERGLGKKSALITNLR